MPELPEVEVVRRGLQQHVVGTAIIDVAVGRDRAIRRHIPGPADFRSSLIGQQIVAADRRGKFLWLTLEPSGRAIVVHLGMSGQMLVQAPGTPREKHAHIVAQLTSGTELRFVDQRTFGGWQIAELVEADGTRVPEPVAHIARDPLDPLFDPVAVTARIRAKNTEIKRVLLDQTVVSGIGNIYADEALWRAKLHGRRLTSRLSRPAVRALLEHAQAVMLEALDQGGTSFDALYVNVNGQSGYFSRALAAYGQEGLPCRRCGAPMRREAFMNRSSYSCPRCQPSPRKKPMVRI